MGPFFLTGCIWSRDKAELVASSDDVEQARVCKTGQLLDARRTSQYLGSAKKMRCLAMVTFLVEKTFCTNCCPQTATRPTCCRLQAVAIYKSSGVDPQAPVITYCNTGQLAACNWFVLSEILGNKQAFLYDGFLHKGTLEKRALQSIAR